MCQVSHNGINISAAIMMVLIPLLVMVVFKMTPALGKQLDWNSTRRCADYLYLGLFLFVLLQSERFADVVCYVSHSVDATSSAASSFESTLYNNNVIVEAVQCKNLGCEVLQDGQSTEACDVCQSHVTAGTALIMIVWILQAITTLMIAILSSRDVATTNLFTTYKIIHALNATVWLIVGYTIQLFRCDCRWSWTTNVTTAFFSPLSAILFIMTAEAQKHFYPVGETAVLTGIQKPMYKHLNGKEVIILSEPDAQNGRREVVLADEMPADESMRTNTVTDFSWVEEGQRKSIKTENLKQSTKKNKPIWVR